MEVHIRIPLSGARGNKQKKIKGVHLISEATQEVGHARRRGEEGRVGERKGGEGELCGAFSPPLVLKEQQRGKIDTVGQRGEDHN